MWCPTMSRCTSQRSSAISAAVKSAPALHTSMLIDSELRMSCEHPAHAPTAHAVSVSRMVCQMVPEPSST